MKKVKLSPVKFFDDLLLSLLLSFQREFLLFPSFSSCHIVLFCRFRPTCETKTIKNFTNIKQLNLTHTTFFYLCWALLADHQPEVCGSQVGNRWHKPTSCTLSFRPIVRLT